MYHKNIIKDCEENKEIIKNFIVNRGLYFSKYFKNLDVIEKDNENVKSFCSMKMIEISKEKFEEFANKNMKELYTRSSENIFNYWKTRFSVKGIPLNLNDIIKSYNFKLDNNNIIERNLE